MTNTCSLLKLFHRFDNNDLLLYILTSCQTNSLPYHSLTVPSATSTFDNEILLGVTGSTTAFRVSSDHTNNGLPKITVTSPMATTIVTYSSDIRIKQDIDDVDTDEILARMRRVNIKSYTYTKEWLKVRQGDDVRVRGVIAQELAEVFPEYVTVLPQYHIPEYNFTIKDFHQVRNVDLDVFTPPRS